MKPLSTGNKLENFDYEPRISLPMSMDHGHRKRYPGSKLPGIHAVSSRLPSSASAIIYGLTKDQLSDSRDFYGYGPTPRLCINFAQDPLLLTLLHGDRAAAIFRLSIGELLNPVVKTSVLDLEAGSIGRAHSAGAGVANVSISIRPKPASMKESNAT